MSHPTLKPSLALLIAIAAALVAQPMRAAVIGPTLVITEFSSTSLTAILNGTTSLGVTLDSADHWTIALAGLTGSPIQGWLEPDAAGFVNIVHFDSITGLTVSSDLGPGFTQGLANNTTDFFTFILNGSPLSVTFNDLGDVATVPDTGTTCSLLGLSLTGLALLRRKLC